MSSGTRTFGRNAPLGPGWRSGAAGAGVDDRAFTFRFNNTFGVAAAILALGAGATIARNSDASTLPVTEQAAAPDSAAITTAFPEPSIAPRTVALQHRASTVPGVALPPNAATPGAAAVVPDDTQTVEAPETAPPEPLRLTLLHAAIPPDRLRFGAPSAWERVRGGAGVKDALRSAAGGLVDDWRAPEGREREVSLFVSSDDEALNWSLSRGSRNHGGVTYQKDRVDIGNAAAGLAVSIGDAQVAAAYVQRDVGSNFGGHSQDYGGIILTLRH